MNGPTDPEHPLPGRIQAIGFLLKSRVFQARRGLAELFSRPPRHLFDRALIDAPVVAEIRTPLWGEISAAEFPLTAGKVENLRRAARAFHGLEIPAGHVFSFWRQLGRTSRLRGFIHGRELREGCVVPAVGGGLCQLSGLLYQAALAAGLEIVERHRHSRIIPGSLAASDLDATVFWNYVDLRFRGDADWRVEVTLTSADLVVRIRSAQLKPAALRFPALPPQPRLPATGDCLTCGMISCFRHPAATAAHAPSLGHSAFLLDAVWPEFDRWCRDHARTGDVWLMPLDGQRWKRPAYRWSPPSGVKIRYATLAVLWRSWRQRRLPGQGAARQQALLQGDAALAHRFARMLSPTCRHLVVSQNLLPHLWKIGALEGRSFDVLIQRWPMDELQRRLDQAHARHPLSSTLGDFRADPELVRLEREALGAAARLITPHRDIARHFSDRAWRIDWELPDPTPAVTPRGDWLFFPASRLGRKGAFELAQALMDLPPVAVKYLGRATEDGVDPFGEILSSPATAADLQRAQALVLPAWIEHQPRLALRALSAGIPVIATEACGLPDHPLLHTIRSPDPAALRDALRSVLQLRDEPVTRAEPVLGYRSRT